MGDIWLLMAHSDYSSLGKLPHLFLSSYKSRTFPCHLEQWRNVRNVKVVEWIMRNPTSYQKINKICRLGGESKWTLVLIWILKRWSSLCCSYLPLILGLRKHTYLAGEIPWSRRGFSQGEAHLLRCGCVDLCDVPKCGKLDCIICGSRELHACFPLVTIISMIELPQCGGSLTAQAIWFPGERNSSPLRYSLRYSTAVYSTTKKEVWRTETLLKYPLVYSLDCGNATEKPTQFLQQVNDLKGKRRTAIDQERWRARERESKEGRKKLKASMHVRDLKVVS